MRSTQKLKRFVREHPVFLHARAWTMRLSGASRPIENIYFPTVQRSGSQWMKEVFSDGRVRRYTGLRPFPQRRYEWGEFVRRFPSYTFVPGLYVSYDLYEEIAKPKRYRTFYVLRDPRSIVVSWYHAMLKTHVLMGKVGKYREDLKQLSFEDGISYCIRALTGKFADMRTWWDHRDDPNVTILRFEDMIPDTTAAMARVLDECGVKMPAEELAAVMREHSKDEIRKRDKRTVTDPTMCHYRPTTSNHREAFTAEHYRLFREVTGNLVTYLGYEEFDAPAAPAPAAGPATGEAAGKATVLPFKASPSVGAPAAP